MRVAALFYRPKNVLQFNGSQVPRTCLQISLRKYLSPEFERPYTFAPLHGAIAQLGERLHGMQEVAGSIPAGSTKFFDCT